ncbi:MAG: hypothetical protein WA775_10965 [Psychroserpens sp.]|uniref:hypothetical protein n=1 Tax=Psychroserpens sp. TaxID=2020870 RepID=UPI003C779B9C
MIEVIYVMCSVPFTIIMGLKAKKHLYVHQHEKSIERELEKFEKNLDTFKKLDLSNTYDIGSDHIYK